LKKIGTESEDVVKVPLYGNGALVDKLLKIVAI
jgi:hypothetical protein